MADKREAAWKDCPKAIGDCQDSGDGRCTFCGRRIAAPPARPRRMPASDLTTEYRRHYDPDYGSGRDDT